MLRKKEQQKGETPGARRKMDGIRAEFPKVCVIDD